MFKNKKIIIVVILVIIILAGLIYLNQSYQPLKGNEKFLNADNVIEQNKYYYFKTETDLNTAFIFYPGGKVEETAYAPLIKMLSDRGYPAFLVKMPFNLAVFDKNRAEIILKEYQKQFDNFYIIGHSLGGAMAASYIENNIDTFTGLIFLASYPPDNVDFSNTKINILSITASNDQIIDSEKLEETKDNLPSKTEFNIIKGGNHAGFGNYGPQQGDGVSTITKEKQWETTVDMIINFVQNVREGN